MFETTQSQLRLVAFALLATVASQIFYITVVQGSDGGGALRPYVWTLEAVAFSLATIGALAALAHSRGLAIVLGAIALGSVTNVIQVGMGLAEFGPAREASGEVFNTVLAGAFFLYFHAKAMYGLAALLLGLAALKSGGGLKKGLGGLAALAGLAALVLGIYSMGVGMGIMFAAGAAGTAATALLALLLLGTNGESAAA